MNLLGTLSNKKGCSMSSGSKMRICSAKFGNYVLAIPQLLTNQYGTTLHLDSKPTVIQNCKLQVRLMRQLLQINKVILS